MEDIMKIVKLLEKSGLLIKRISKTAKKWRERTKKCISSNINRNISC